MITDCIQREASRKFFEESRYGDGVAYLVATAVFGRSNEAKELSKEDIQTFMTTCQVISKISKDILATTQ